jgi:hypothetical protein
MYLLAGALLIRRERFQVAGLDGNVVRQLAGDILLIKARSIVEFLTPTKKRERKARITVESLGILDAPRDSRFLRLFAHASQRSAHLTWERAQDPLPLIPSIDDEGLNVLRHCATICARAYENGMRLSARRHQLRHGELVTLLRMLGIPYPDLVT